MIPGSLSDRPLLNAVRAEIDNLDARAVRSVALENHDAAVAYQVASARLRLVLQDLGFEDVRTEVYDHQPSKLGLQILSPSMLEG